MREFVTDKSNSRTKAYGVILAGLVAVVSLTLAAVTHEPKKAVSSPRPVKAALVPQIADSKSEAEILFRGKSFASFKRAVILPMSADVDEIKAKAGQQVRKDDILSTYTLDRSSMMKVHRVLYPEAVIKLKSAVFDQEVTIKKLKTVSMELKNLELEKAEAKLKDVRGLSSRDMAPKEAVEDAERHVKGVKKEIQSIRDSVRQAESALEKTQGDLQFYQGKQKRDLDLLEWQTKRSYEDKGVPLDRGFLKAPISGQVVWVSPMFRVGSQQKSGAATMTIAPMNSIVVRCKVHELDLVKLKPGDKGSVSFDAIPEKEYTCKVSRIPWVSRNPALEVPADYEIECSLEDPDSVLKEGLTCNVKVSIVN